MKKQSYSHVSQRGLIGWLVALPSIGLVLIIGIKIVPFYIEYQLVSKIVSEFISLDETRGHSSEHTKVLLNRRFVDNQIDIPFEDILVVREYEGAPEATITVKYIRKEEISSGLGVFVDFTEEAHLPAP